MKSRSSISSKNNDYEGQFKELSYNEMINLRGGETPPTPPTEGNDFPIGPLKSSLNSITYTPPQQIPVLKAQ
ncbi:MAG: hypothetical protein NTY07_18575 [Bacteroidia bacterium]|nr:hypothetical protein [Bacteroidia bacterium]